MMPKRQITERSIIFLYIFAVLSLGIYLIFWTFSTVRDIQSRGGKIPPSIFVLIPFLNIFWCYKYCDAFATTIKKNNNGITYFLISMLIPFVMPGIVQDALNDTYEVENKKKSVSLQAKAA